MSAQTSNQSGVAFRVLDAMDAPHSGRILRLRLQSGEAPSIKSLWASPSSAESPATSASPARDGSTFT
jgi:hypothetical protein